MSDTASRGPHAQVGFLGPGKMGSPMVDRLVRHGVPTTVLSRRLAGREHLAARGARAVAAPADLVDCDVILCMLPDLADLKGVLRADDGLIAAWRSRPARPRIVVVMSSVSPTRVVELGEELASATAGAVGLVDAPVSGGLGGARAGTLSIMVGGTEGEFAAIERYLRMLGRIVMRMGSLGAGSLAKACNQLVVAATVTALGEALVLAERGGLDIDALLDLFRGGMANSSFLEDSRERLLHRDYAARSAARMMQKDLASIRDAAEASATETPVAAAVAHVFDAVIDRGRGDDDVTVVREVLANLSEGVR